MRNKGKKLGHSKPVTAPGSTPLPSALDGREWAIRDSGSPTGEAWIKRPNNSTGPGTMLVPLGPSERERRVRLHEMAHVRWTPPVGTEVLPDGVTWDTFNSVEDARMHRRLAEVGYRDNLDTPMFGYDEWDRWEDSFRADSEDRVPGEPPRWDAREVARMLAATVGTNEYSQFAEMADRWGYGWVQPLTEEILKRTVLKRRPAFREAIQAATELDELFGPDGSIEKMEPELKRKVNRYDAKPGGWEWGDLTILTMPLTVPMPRLMRSRRNRATDTGAVPRNWHRMPVDSRVFNRKKRKPSGGTVLLDQSGSMGLSVETVIELMQLFPAVTIATYAGQGEGGELRVIARNGKRAADGDCFHPMGGNIVDGPALEWLNSQAAPRVWVSDGHVTGKHESTGLPLLMEADALVKKGKVLTVRHLEHLIEE